MKLSIPISATNLTQGNNFVRLGIPLNRGAVPHCDYLKFSDPQNDNVAASFTPTATWADGSIKWCIAELTIESDSAEKQLSLHVGEKQSAPKKNWQVKHSDKQVQISDSDATYTFDKQGNSPFPAVSLADNPIWPQQSVIAAMTGESADNYALEIQSFNIDSEDTLAFKCSYLVRLSNQSGHRLNATFSFELLPDAQLNVAVELHNLKRVQHRGGIWDLGDPGSELFQSFSINLPRAPEQQAQLKPSITASWVSAESQLSLFQASSGGKNWDSPVHVNAKNEMPNRFKGYELNSAGETLLRGDRSEPTLFVEDLSGSAYAVSIKSFWENFPKAIELNPNTISLQLFPAAHGDLFELQGGERKTHNMCFRFQKQADKNQIQFHNATARLDPDTYSQAQVIPYFDPTRKHAAYDDLISPSLDPDKGFFAKRENIDEFGWRNFGEVYADHESHYHTEDSLFVSHYNNQYDNIWGFGRQFALTGDARWFKLMHELAEHVMDIDIYKTEEDRPEYNNGYFWHTDHYVPAGTATHRTYSARQADYHPDHPSGGGPGIQHCYSSGLTLFHFLTGCQKARTTVLELGEWAHHAVDGTGAILEAAYKTLRGGEASSFISTCKGNKVFKYTYPMDRGMGNYIRTNMDCYDLTQDQKYLDRVEHAIKNTAGPYDEIDARGFIEDIDYTWFYVIFLQDLIRYLDTKRAIQQTDEAFHYARSTLLHYADWMVDNETPYLENSDQLAHANATWAAQEPRRVQVLYAAYRYSTSDRSRFLKKAKYFRDKCIDMIKNDDTMHYTRVQALLLQGHGPSALLDIDSLPYSGLTDATVDSANEGFHTPASHLKQISKMWATSLLRFNLGKEVRWIKSRSGIKAQN